MSSSESWGTFDHPSVVQARATFEKVGAGPPPKDRFCYDQWFMAAIHATICNGLEAAYKNATHIAPNDLAAYLDASKEAFAYLDHHHEHEENYYFPYFEKHMSMDANKEQHATFVGGVEDAIAYIDKVHPRQPNPEPFSAKRLREIVDGFLPTACVHMMDELQTLEPDTLRRHMTVEELTAAFNAVGEVMKARDNPVTALPALVCSRPKGCAFPDEAPWFVINILAPVFTLTQWGKSKYYWSERRWERTPASPLT